MFMMSDREDTKDTLDSDRLAVPRARRQFPVATGRPCKGLLVGRRETGPAAVSAEVN